MWMDGKLVGRAGHHGILRRPGPEGRGVLVGRWDVLRVLHRRVSSRNLRVRAIVGALVAQPAGTGKKRRKQKACGRWRAGGGTHLLLVFVI